MVSYLGIDVSSLSLDAAVRPQGIRLHVSNDPAGFEALLDALGGLSIKRGKRSISGGRFEARRSLCMSCLVAIKYNPSLKARYGALRGRGKVTKVAIVACMRVFLVRLNAMLSTGSPGLIWSCHSPSGPRSGGRRKSYRSGLAHQFNTALDGTGFARARATSLPPREQARF